MHIIDAPGHQSYYELNKTDEIISYLTKNNFSIAGFTVGVYANSSFLRSQKIFENNGNKNYFIDEFSTLNKSKDYFLNLVYSSFQNIFIDEVEIIKR